MRLFISSITLLILSIIPYVTFANGSIPSDNSGECIGLKTYKIRMAHLESTTNSNAVNQFGYVGTYQIGRLAAMDVGVPYDSLIIPKWNEIAMIRLMRNNWRYLKDCHGFVGLTINGVLITKAGMLAAAHTCGWYNVYLYLQTTGETNNADGNGVTVEYRLKAFQDIHEINF